jgi:hypothetical protein
VIFPLTVNSNKMAIPIVKDDLDFDPDLLLSSEEEMLSLLKDVYKDYCNKQNISQIKIREGILKQMFYLNHMTNTDEETKGRIAHEKYSLQNEYEDSLKESMIIAHNSSPIDYRTYYQTLYEFKRIYQEFASDGWFSLDTWFETFDELADYLYLD